MSSEEDSQLVQPSAPGACRKRIPQLENRRRSLERRQVIASNGARPSIVCDHEGERWCQVRTLLLQDLESLHASLYSHGTKALQDAFIVQKLELQPINRHRGETSATDRQHSTVYRLKRFDDVLVRVCLESFCGILGVEKRRVQRLAAHYRDTGLSRPETRGGARVFQDVERLRDSIKRHIEGFKCVPSHYGRNKTPNRK